MCNICLCSNVLRLLSPIYILDPDLGQIRYLVCHYFLLLGLASTTAGSELSV